MRFLFFISVLFLSSLAQGAEVKNIRMGTHPDKTRLVIDMTGKMDFHAAVQNNPKRLVIHFPTKNWTIAGNTQTVLPFINVKHSAASSDLSKITFDMNAPAIIQNAYMLPSNNKGETRLVIDVAQTSRLDFEKHVGRAYGSLKIKSRTPHASLDSLIKTIADHLREEVPTDLNEIALMRQSVWFDNAVEIGN
ncbi:MAG: hypothetical protein COB76_04580 [Alphaproteobacteria bacterium]|nr:MAG: hypothetical protein COB76_04580 [Alphaproteobacteria bacterium]